MMTFVQATYVMETFVHISNISAVSDPILTKLCEPNILWALIFISKFFFEQKSFGPNVFLNQICIMTYFF